MAVKMRNMQKKTTCRTRHVTTINSPESIRPVPAAIRPSLIHLSVSEPVQALVEVGWELLEPYVTKDSTAASRLGEFEHDIKVLLHVSCGITNFIVSLKYRVIRGNNEQASTSKTL